MKWSKQAWQSIEPIYASILEMPFIDELSKGHLPREKFQFYMAQDAIYLAHFGRALAMIGAKAHALQDALAYMQFAENAIVVEHALHESYFQDFGLADKGIAEPACHHYIHFLQSMASFETVEVAMASTLPCFWIYKKVGDHIYSNHHSANNPYQRWIDTYAGEDFSIAVQRAIAICDSVADEVDVRSRDQMTQAFITASRLEYAFWEGAYTKRVWK